MRLFQKPSKAGTGAKPCAHEGRVSRLICGGLIGGLVLSAIMGILSHVMNIPKILPPSL